MQLAKSILIVACGTVIGAAFALWRGYGSRARADTPAVKRLPAAPAAVCDCPPAEPPLAGRFVVVTNTQMTGAGQTVQMDAMCPPGAQLISGSCTTALADPIRDVTLRQSGFYNPSVPTGWHCDIRNNEAIAINMKISAICLKPAP